MIKKKYHKFTEQLVFAIVMRDASLCKELIERIIPDRKVREIRFAENLVMDALAKSIADKADERSGAGQSDRAVERYEMDVRDRAGQKSAFDRSSGWMTVETEKVLIPALLSKSVRFDALFEDEGAWVDIEMQVDWEADMPLRIRYYQASKTITSLESGDEYRNLKPGYVIFICLFDYFEKGEAVYRFQNLEENLHLPLGDKQFTIILNLKCPEAKIPEKLRTFYRYVNSGDAGDDAFTRRIQYLVDRANESGEVQNMITVAGDIAYKEKKLEAQLKQMEEKKAQLEAENGKLEAENGKLEAENGKLEEKLEQAEAEKIQMQTDLKNEKLETARKFKEQGVSTDIIAAATGLDLAVIETL